MTDERWPRVKALFQAAVERPTEERDAFLAAATADDASLRRDVESLLASDTSEVSFLDRLPVAGTSVLVDPLAALTTSMDPTLAPGSQLGPYQILSLLGAGGMGQVYKAFDPRLHREIAIKIAAERFSERFDREVRAIATLNHPNICTIHDVGPNYLVTELVDGETLRDWFGRALPIERNLEIARQVLEALRAAHHAGIVHRDLKPENVMVRADGYVKVLDFGLAVRMPTSHVLHAETVVTTDSTFIARETDVDSRRLSHPGQILGTIPYMSPEQIQGRDVDQRSDLFAFGIILYEMLTGRHPWPRPSPVETLHAILHDDAPSIPAASLMHAELAAIVQKLLRKSPAERYQVADAVLEALGSRTASGGSSAAIVAGATPLTSIAVLPFNFLSGVEDGKGLSLGFADALITMLGRLEDITVLPTSAILNYAAGTDPARACRDLGTRHVLQGNVQKLGAHWRVSMHLFDAMTQKSIFSEQHDFDLENVFDVQDEVGREVVESLRKRLPSAVPKSRDRYSSDPEAYNEFMAGLRESSGYSPEVFQSAAAHLSNAVERDPDFALAHAWLSHVSMQMYFGYDPQRSWLEKAERHCQRALVLDPDLAEAHWARAAILWSPAKNFQHAEAIAALERVLEARPNFDRAHNRMAAICLHIGRFEEARIAHAHALKSNPNNVSYNLPYIDLYSGDFARAKEAAEAWLQESPGNKNALCLSAHALLLAAELDAAGDRLAVALGQFPDEPLLITLQGMLHARRGEAGAALDCVRRALDFPIVFGHAHHTHHQIACIHAVLGEIEKAMAWLEKSIDEGYPCWPFFRIDPYLENLRPEPRFQQSMAALEREFMGLKIQKL